MNCVLVAVDGAKGSRACVAACARLFADRPPPAVILLHVMQYGGPTAVDGLISDAELAELRETLEGSPQLEALKAKAEATLAAPRTLLEGHGFGDLRTVIKIGRPAEEIVRAATEYGADLIVIGNTRGPIDKLMLGDVAQKVASAATVPVLLTR
jgi:nucleotide-binding universal stress UspA family protein